MLLSSIVLDYSSGYLSTGGFLVVMTAVIALTVSMFPYMVLSEMLIISADR